MSSCESEGRLDPQEPDPGSGPQPSVADDAGGADSRRAIVARPNYQEVVSANTHKGNAQGVEAGVL